MRASEIYRKYYHDIASPDFEKIVSADAVSSSLQRDKLGKYAKWMLDLYRRKYLKMEDLYKATDYIAVFDKASRMRRLPDTDLNHYKSLPDMYRIIEPFIEVKSKTEKVRNIRESEAEKLFEDFVFTVIHPKTRAASVLYGKGTQWCTAARKYNNFRYYNESGKLYIIINKLSGRKYQFHVESESFMDENDRPLTDGGDPYTCTLKKINATPELFDYFKWEIPWLYYEFERATEALAQACRNDIFYTWELFYEHCYNQYTYYIVLEKYGHQTLYRAKCTDQSMELTLMIDPKFGVEKIIPLQDFTRQNELVIMKDSQYGIYNINTDTIRWGYRGKVDEKIKWNRKEKLDLSRFSQISTIRWKNQN